MVMDRLFGWLRPKRQSTERSEPRRNGGARSGAGRKSAGRAKREQSADTGTFAQALCAVSPDFERYYRLDGAGAEEAAAAVYVGLPPTGKVSRAAVIRQFLVLKARADGNEEAANTIARLSDNAAVHAARRSHQPI